MKLIDQFGCDLIDGNLIKRVTKYKAHTWLRRGLFFSNKDLAQILDDYERGESIYIYTGRGPSSDMHLGHCIPFWFTKYLQDAFQCFVIIQMSDDEKFFFKGSADKKGIDYYNSMTYKNAKDIVACGFDPDRTLIFSNYRMFGQDLYWNAAKMEQSTTGNQLRGIYGLDLNNNAGEIGWPCRQCAPAYSNSFPDILHPSGPFTEPFYDGYREYSGRHTRCLVPMAIDQDPYFRMARDFAEKMKGSGYLKPATIHSKFIVGLAGIRGKMNSTGEGANMTLYLNDDVREIKSKIKKHAYSGGKDTRELQERYGANLHVDVCYQYLTYFLDSDEELAAIAHAYRSGAMLTGQIKDITADVIGNLIARHQERVASITEEDMRKFFNRNRAFNLSRDESRPALELESDDRYATYGCSFDVTCGARPSEEALEFEIENA